MGAALAPTIYVDDIRVARVGNARRVTIRLSPGPHAVHSDDKDSVIRFEAKAGQEYYIRIDEVPGKWKGHGMINLVMPEEGMPQFEHEQPVELDRRYAKDMIEKDSND